MELFTVTCTTCQSRLKVRERQVIGQILACPKCQGMVLVQPPAGWIDPGEQATAAPIVTAPVASPHTTTEHVAESTFDEAADLLSRRSEPAAPPMHDAEPLPPGADWTTPAQRMRRWLLIGGLASVGAIGLIVLLVWSLRGKPEEVAQVETPPTEVVKEVEPPAEVIPPPAKPTPETTEPVVPKPAPEKVTPEPVKPSEPKPPAPEEMKPEPKPPTPETPPELAPVPGETEPKPGDKPKPLNTFNVENTLKDFGALIEDKPFDKPAQPGDAAPPAEPMPASEEQVDEEPLPRPDQRKIDIARRLADPLEAVEMTEMPLADFLQFATDLSTIPFTLEPSTLPAIKASPESKVSVSLKKTNVSSLLAAALGPHNLAFVAGESGIVVLPSASAQGKLRQIKHDVSDLAKDEASVRTLAELIPAVVDPTSWQASGGPGELAIEGSSLVVTQSPEVHFSLMVLLEKLRLARKLPTRTQYPATVLTLTPRYTAAQTKLDQLVTWNFVPPTRLNKVNDRIRATTGLRVLVNWRALGEEGWTPETEVKIGAANVSLAQFLDRLTRRMELAYRVLDAQTLEITTRGQIEAQPDLEVYPWPGGDETLIGKLQTALGSDNFGPGQSCVLRYDVASQAIVARLPQPLQKKLGETLGKL